MSRRASRDLKRPVTPDSDPLCLGAARPLPCLIEMLSHAAFLRFVTLGRKGQTNDGLVQAYLDAGASHAEAFIASGNVVFGTSDDPGAVAHRAQALLRDRIAFDQPAHVRSLDHLAREVDRDPFLRAPDDDPHARFVTFLPDPVPDLPQPPIATKRRDFLIFAIEGTEAYSVTYLVNGRQGSPNAFLERYTSTGLTTRNWNTVCRLVDKYA